MAFVGAISYSLYLWHWPFIVIVKLGVVYRIRAGTLAGDAFVVVASLIVATLSWRFIEQPFRTGRFKRLRQRNVFKLAGACAAVFSMVVIIIQIKHGFPERFPLKAREVSTYMDVLPRMRTGTCFIETGFQILTSQPACTKLRARRICCCSEIATLRLCGGDSKRTYRV